MCLDMPLFASYDHPVEVVDCDIKSHHHLVSLSRHGVLVHDVRYVRVLVHRK